MEMFEELLVVVAVAAHLLFDPDTRVRLLEALVEIPVTEVPEHGDPEDDLPARRRLRSSRQADAKGQGERDERDGCERTSCHRRPVRSRPAGLRAGCAEPYCPPRSRQPRPLTAADASERAPARAFRGARAPRAA